MQFSSMDEEEGDFTLNAATRSRLSSLFQGEGNNGGDVNQALTFTAPKQPRKNVSDTAQSTSDKLKLLKATVVHAYKLQDGKYIKQGKLGCAILGLHETSRYNFLLYKGKQIQVTSCSITPSFKFHVQLNNYVNFYDEKNENWSINFDSEADLVEFAKQIALAKANSEGKNHSTLIIQDLTLGDGPSLDIGDSVDVKFTGRLLTNHIMGQVFDTNMESDSSLRLRLGKSKVIKGWSEGLIGAQKGSRRLLIIPPSLAYGSEGVEGSVPPNSSLIFEVSILKLKLSRDASHSPSPAKVPENVPEKKPEVQPRSSFSHEDNIRMRGASISEQLSQSPKKDKAHLISRMAKMGTATLPFQGAIPAQVSSESEDEEEAPRESPPVQTTSECGRVSPKPAVRTRSRQNSGSTSITQPLPSQPTQENIPIQVAKHVSQMSLYSQSALPVQTALMPQASPFPNFSPMLPPQFQMTQSSYQMPGMAMSVADTHLPLMLAETQRQGSETRTGLSKISDKIDTVIQKVTDLNIGQGRTTSISHSSYMDSSTLLQNIERIVQENKTLKEEAEVKDSKIKLLNQEICDLLQKNRRFFEESNSFLEHRSDTIQAASAQAQGRISLLEKEKEELSSNLYMATSKMKLLETELCDLKNKEVGLHEKLLKYENKVESNFNGQDEEGANALQVQLNKLQHEENMSKSKMEALQRQCDEAIESKNDIRKRMEEKLSEVQEIESRASAQLSEMKQSYELEIEHLKEKLKEVSASTEGVTDVDKFKIDIETLTKEKAQVLAGKESLSLEYQEIKQQLKAAEASEEKHKLKIKEIQTELESYLSYRKKYEVFHEKTKAMKEHYENQIAELLKRLKTSKPSTISPDFSGEIKKVMNVLYKLLQGKFEPNTLYTGDKILEITLQAIRHLTLQMLERKSQTDQDTQNDKQYIVASQEDKSSQQLSHANILSASGDNRDLVSESAAQQNGTNIELSREKSAVSSSEQPLESLAISSESFVPETIGENSTDTSPDSQSQHFEQPRSDLKIDNQQNVEEIVADHSSINNSGDTKLDDSTEPPISENTLDNEKSKETQDARCSPELPELLPTIHVFGRLTRNITYAFMFICAVLWIGAWVHDMETPTSPTL